MDQLLGWIAYARHQYWDLGALLLRASLPQAFLVHEGITDCTCFYGLDDTTSALWLGKSPCVRSPR